MSISSLIKTHLTSQVVGTLASKIGVSPTTAKSIVNSAMPLVLGMMAKNAAKDESSAKSLFNAIEKHDGSVYGKVEQDPQSLVAEGERMLGHVFGDKSKMLDSLMAKATGGQVDATKGSQLMKAVAPLMMGALGQEQTKQGLDFSAMMQQVQSYGTEPEEKQEQSMLASLLDQDGDGSVMDDMFGLAKKFLS